MLKQTINSGKNAPLPQIFGDYLLLAHLGSGGMAEMYVAKRLADAKFSRLLALKCLWPHFSEDQTVRNLFINEAKIAASLNHVGIVQIYELGQLDQRFYIAMELIHGHDLGHLLQTAHQHKQKIPLHLAAYIIVKIAEALDFAHKKTNDQGLPLHIVHNDIAPANILLSFVGDVKITDFGVSTSKAYNDLQELKKLTIGRCAYFSPERANEQENIDQRSDIFALGAVLYEVLTGTQLFGAKNNLAALAKIRDLELPNFSKKIPNCPPLLKEIFEKCLAKDPDKRFNSASELANALLPLTTPESGVYPLNALVDFLKTIYQKEIDNLGNTLQQYNSLAENYLATTSKPDKSFNHTPLYSLFADEHVEESPPPFAAKPLDLNFTLPEDDLKPEPLKSIFEFPKNLAQERVSKSPLFAFKEQTRYVTSQLWRWTKILIISGLILAGGVTAYRVLAPTTQLHTYLAPVVNSVTILSGRLTPYLAPYKKTVGNFLRVPLQKTLDYTLELTSNQQLNNFLETYTPLSSLEQDLKPVLLEWKQQLAPDVPAAKKSPTSAQKIPPPKVLSPLPTTPLPASTQHPLAPAKKTLRQKSKTRKTYSNTLR